MNEALLLIGGDSVPAADNRFFQRINPVSGKPATKAVASSLRDVQSAVNAAAQVFPAWAATGPGKRRELLLRAADVMVASQGDFVATMIAETGATARNPGRSGDRHAVGLRKYRCLQIVRVLPRSASIDWDSTA